MTNKITAQTIIDFWFSDKVKPLWFNSTKEFDGQLRRDYLKLYEEATDGKLDIWKSTPAGCVALCIILDQFPLNMFRNHARAFSTEAIAREFALYAIQSGFDLKMNDEQKLFLYLPFMHSENIADQDLSVSLFEKAGMKDNMRYALHHREIIRQFGRFPHRNKALGRNSSEAEDRYLNSDEAFHG